MHPRPLFLAAVLGLCALVPASAAAVDPVEWDAAAAAAQEIDPTIDPPPNDAGVVSAVGGGHPVATEFPTFALGAVEGPAGLRGRMTLNLGFGNAFHAEVVCLTAISLGDGASTARLVGALEPSTFTFPTLVFDVTDGGPGEPGDAWHAQFSPLAPTAQPCTPSGSTSPIDGSIAINVP